MIASEGVRPIGGEMIEWSDAGDDLPGGEALETMIAGVVPAGGDVFVAGPHRSELIGRLLRRCDTVTCLLRSLPDAVELQRAHGAGGGLTVLCGDLESLAGARGPQHVSGLGPFDAIVAAGGFRRLCTPETPPLTWAESLRRLAGFLAPGGTLVMAAENELGVHRLADPAPADQGDEHWFPPHGADDTVPIGPDELVRSLQAVTLAETDPHHCYAAYPCPEAPTVLLPAGRLAQQWPADGVPAVFASTALDSYFTGRPVLFDPGRLARASLGKGLGGRLAPAWIAVIRPAAEPPEALITDCPGPLSVTCALAERPPGETPGWERRPISPAETVLAGRIARDVARMEGVVPAGRVLDQLLLTACSTSDLPALRGLLRSYAGWLAGRPPAVQPFATPGNVVVGDTVTGAGVVGADAVGDGPEGSPGWSLLDPSWELAEPVPAEVALVRAMRGFAAGLLAGGHRHPWPTTLDIDGITAVLIAMAGRRPDQALLGQAIRLEAEITAAREGLAISERERLVAELERGLAPRPMGLREALTERERLITELAEARDRGVWLDATLREKEARLVQATEAHAQVRTDLRAVKAELAALRQSRLVRLGRLLSAPGRRAVQVGRRARTSAEAQARAGAGVSAGAPAGETATRSS